MPVEEYYIPVDAHKSNPYLTYGQGAEISNIPLEDRIWIFKEKNYPDLRERVHKDPQMDQDLSAILSVVEEYEHTEIKKELLKLKLYDTLYEPHDFNNQIIKELEENREYSPQLKNIVYKSKQRLKEHGCLKFEVAIVEFDADFRTERNEYYVKVINRFSGDPEDNERFDPEVIKKYCMPGSPIWWGMDLIIHERKPIVCPDVGKTDYFASLSKKNTPDERVWIKKALDVGEKLIGSFHITFSDKIKRTSTIRVIRNIVDSERVIAPRILSSKRHEEMYQKNLLLETLTDALHKEKEALQETTNVLKKKTEELEKQKIKYMMLAKKHRETAKQNELLSLTDKVTGLPNLMQLEDIKLKEQLEIWTRNGTSFSVALIDLDNFKHFNDNYRHKCGDIVLKTVADYLLEHKRAVDFLARLYKGDEFVLVMPETKSEEGIAPLKRYYSNLGKLNRSVKDVVKEYINNHPEEGYKPFAGKVGFSSSLLSIDEIAEGTKSAANVTPEGVWEASDGPLSRYKNLGYRGFIVSHKKIILNPGTDKQKTIKI